jgi:cyclic pyranopterin phosphate synthase
MNLTHLDEQNRPKMVDVSNKDISNRVAIASGKIKMSQDAFKVAISDNNKKGSVLHTATIASISGAKKTSDLIPMCHLLMLSGVKCDIEELVDLPGFKLSLRVKTTGQTGVEMEALSGVSIGLLTIYDMLKAVDKSMELFDIKLEHKSGGKSGEYNA